MARKLYSRQEASFCGSRNDAEPYNLSMQIGALFIILAVSASACALPLIVSRTPRLRIPLKLLFIVRHFGTGVLLATAFVHLLPTAFVSLTDPCLPPFFNESYPAFAGAIALASVFVITSIEMLFSPGRKCCASNIQDIEKLSEPSSTPAETITGTPSGPLPGRLKPGRNASNGRELARMVDRTQSFNRSETLDAETAQMSIQDKVLESSQEPNGQWQLTDEEHTRKKAAVQCVLLEIGILFHSVFIGMSLAVSVGNDLTILLVAIAFHQLFEGLALGSRIAAVPWGSSRIRKAQPWLMCLAYGCTTPLGQALGISTHTLYDPDSMTGLLVVGSMNAISAGLLTYTSLVDLLSEDFLSDQSWKTLRGNTRVFAFSLVFLGAFGMSLIGAWA